MEKSDFFCAAILSVLGLFVPGSMLYMVNMAPPYPALVKIIAQNYQGQILSPAMTPVIVTQPAVWIVMNTDVVVEVIVKENISQNSTSNGA